MKLNELIETLQQLAQEYGDETEVRLAVQPSWPFEHGIGRIEAVDLNGGEDEDEGEGGGAGPDANVIVYIGEASQIGYLPGAASRALGWR
jgi:hypothetical protein